MRRKKVGQHWMGRNEIKIYNIVLENMLIYYHNHLPEKKYVSKQQQKQVLRKMNKNALKLVPNTYQIKYFKNV